VPHMPANRKRPRLLGDGARYRLLHVVTHPIQYFAPLYRALSARHDIDLHVVFASKMGLGQLMDSGFGQPIAWDVPILEGFESSFLPGAAARPKTGALPQMLASFRRILGTDAYDAVWVHGYTPPSSIAAIAVALANRIPVLLRDDATLIDPRPLHRRLAKRLVLPPLLRHISFLYIGSANRRYWQHYGIADDRLYFAPYSVDNAFFRRQAAALPAKAALRRRFGLPDEAPVALLAGKLIGEKDPITFLSAIAHPTGSAFGGLLAGDGPLRRDVECYIESNSVAGVRVSGFLNQTEISQAYGCADVLVLPSIHERWGLVVNEAMNFGLPIIVSDKVGSAEDLVASDRNGYVFPSGNPRALAFSLGLLADESRRRAFGKKSLELVSKWGVDSTAAGIADAVAQVVAKARAERSGV